MQTRPAHRLIACTYHKAGTNFLLDTFRQIAQEFDYRLWLKFYDPDPPQDGWDICVHQHSRVDDVLRSNSVRGIRCVRHPMSLIYSATLYHQKCTEPWVDVPLQTFSSDTFWAATCSQSHNRIRDQKVDAETKKRLMNDTFYEFDRIPIERFASHYDLDGATYREFLAERPTFEDQLLFEMRCYTRGVLNEMLRFPADARVLRIKLEDVSHETDLESLKEMFTHLGFRGSALLTCMDIASRNSLWHKREAGQKSGHETTGVDDSWRSAFTGEVLREFRRLFGFAEAALGYPEFTPPAACDRTQAEVTASART